MAGWSEKLNQMTQNAISKSKEVAGVAKLNVEISTLNQNIKNVYTEVGKYVVENGLLSEDESVAEWTAKVADLKAEIDGDNEKIHNLKSGNYCPSCGAKLPKASKFCFNCGSAVVIKDSDPEEREQDIIDAEYSEASEESVSEEGTVGNEASEESVSEEGTAGNEASEESVSENAAAGESASEDTVSEKNTAENI